MIETERVKKSGRKRWSYTNDMNRKMEKARKRGQTERVIVTEKTRKSEKEWRKRHIKEIKITGE